MPFSPTSRTVKLGDGRTDPTILVPARVIRDAPSSCLVEAERIWKPARDLVAQALAQSGEGVEHRHWDWENKVLTTESGHHRIVTIE